MVSIGALRLAMEAWRNDDVYRPLAAHLREVFTILEDHILREAPNILLNPKIPERDVLGE
jgi:hypothetical protein